MRQSWGGEFFIGGKGVEKGRGREEAGLWRQVRQKRGKKGRGAEGGRETGGGWGPPFKGGT